MARLLVMFFIFGLTNCYSQKSEKNITAFSCECITQLPPKDDDTKLLIEIQNCISESYSVYHQYIEDLASKYLNENPSEEITDAQNWIRKILTEELVKECPRFNDFVSNAAFKSRHSTDLIRDIARSVCSEIDNLGDQELSWKVIDPIFIRQMNIYKQEINTKYNLSNKKGMDNYSTDLVQELVSTCPKYRKFSVKVNK